MRWYHFLSVCFLRFHFHRNFRATEPTLVCGLCVCEVRCANDVLFSRRILQIFRWMFVCACEHWASARKIKYSSFIYRKHVPCTRSQESGKFCATKSSVHFGLRICVHKTREFYWLIRSISLYTKSGLCNVQIVTFVLHRTNTRCILNAERE